MIMKCYIYNALNLNPPPGVALGTYLSSQLAFLFYNLNTILYLKKNILYRLFTAYKYNMIQYIDKINVYFRFLLEKYVYLIFIVQYVYFIRSLFILYMIKQLIQKRRLASF